jgi:hypothetical protein
VTQATGLRTRENVLGLIDPTILEQVLQNDAASGAAQSLPTSVGRRLLSLRPHEQACQARGPHRRRNFFLAALPASRRVREPRRHHVHEVSHGRRGQPHAHGLLLPATAPPLRRGLFAEPARRHSGTLAQTAVAPPVR